MVIAERNIETLRTVYGSRFIDYRHMSDHVFSRPEDVFNSFGYYPGRRRGDPGLMVGAIALAFLRRVPPLSPKRRWLALNQQHAGHLCFPKRLVASELQVSPAMYSGLCEIAAARYASLLGGWLPGPPPDDILADYRADLRKLGLTYSGAFLTESLYPIDASQEMLDRLCGPGLELTDFGVTDAVAEQSEPAIVVIAQNCD